MQEHIKDLFDAADEVSKTVLKNVENMDFPWNF